MCIDHLPKSNFLRKERSTAPLIITTKLKLLSAVIYSERLVLNYAFFFW